MYNNTYVNRGGGTRREVETQIDLTSYITHNSAEHKFVNETGDKMKGNLDMNNTHKIINMINPTNAQDAATKKYVDDKEFDASKITSGTLSKDRLPKALVENSLIDVASKVYVNTFYQGQTDFKLGNTIGYRGNSGLSRAMVKGNDNVLVINYGGDFIGGVRVDSKLVMNNVNRIVNVKNPSHPKDVANKSYVDAMVIDNKLNINYMRYLDYNFIQTNFKPVLWISPFYNEGFNAVSSSKYPKGKKYDNNNCYLSKIFDVKEKGGNNFIEFTEGGIDSITSKHEFGDTFTFITITRRTNPAVDLGKLFTSNKGVQFFGYFRHYMNVAYQDGEVYVISHNKTNCDSNIHLFIYAAQGDTRYIYDGNSYLGAITYKTKTIWGNLVIGDVSHNNN